MHKHLIITLTSIFFLSMSFGQSTNTYQYDSLNQLVSVFYFNGDSVFFTYDKTGNRITRIANVSLKRFEIKLFLEGPFNGFTMETYLTSDGVIPFDQPYNTTPWNYNGQENFTSLPSPDIVDWVLVELRETTGSASTATADSMIAQKAALLLNDGSIVDRDGFSPLQINVEIKSNLYVVVRHRNHTGIMSAFPLEETDGEYSYDFTSSSSRAYGVNATKEIAPGIWGMIAGDGNADGIVNNLDLDNNWDPKAGEAGYHASDYNMDKEVDNVDKDDVWVGNEGQGSQVPD